MNSDQPLSRLASLPVDASASVSGRTSVPATHSYTLRSRDRPPTDRENVPLTPSPLILEVAQTLVNLSSDSQFQSRTEGESLPSPLVKCTGSAPPDGQTSTWQTNTTHPETATTPNFTLVPCCLEPNPVLTARGGDANFVYNSIYGVSSHATSTFTSTALFRPLAAPAEIEPVSVLRTADYILQQQPRLRTQSPSSSGSSNTALRPPAVSPSLTREPLGSRSRHSHTSRTAASRASPHSNATHTSRVSSTSGNSWLGAFMSKCIDTNKEAVDKIQQVLVNDRVAAAEERRMLVEQKLKADELAAEERLRAEQIKLQQQQQLLDDATHRNMQLVEQVKLTAAAELRAALLESELNFTKQTRTHTPTQDNASSQLERHQSLGETQIQRGTTGLSEVPLTTVTSHAQQEIPALIDVDTLPPPSFTTASPQVNLTQADTVVWLSPFGQSPVHPPLPTAPALAQPAQAAGEENVSLPAVTSSSISTPLLAALTTTVVDSVSTQPTVASTVSSVDSLAQPIVAMTDNQNTSITQSTDNTTVSALTSTNTVVTTAPTSVVAQAPSVIVFRQLHTVRPYNGTTSWTSFRDHFDRCSKANNWSTDIEKVQNLTLALEGPAAEILKDINDSSPTALEEIWRALARRFGDIDEPREAMRRFDARKQYESESIPEYEQALRNLYRN